MSPELDRALERVAARGLLLVACDFDGTLSPIVEDPAAARPDPRALEALSALADLPRTPALILSGRGRDDLERRLGSSGSGIRLIGSHGAESGPSEAGSGSRGAALFLEKLEPVRDRFPGSELEAKPHSVAFHYRRVAEEDQEPARRSAVEAAGGLAVDVRSGKKVVEFMAVRADKGSALDRYRAETGADAVFFIGDDVTDEAAFQALAADDVGVKVGPEPTAAGFRVADPVEVAAVLFRLLRYRTRATGVNA